MSYIEFKAGQKYSSLDADVSDDLSTFRDAGYLLTDDDLIVDIDNLKKESIVAMITKFNIKTHTVWTDRGVHFYFKKPLRWNRASLICALGFEIEFKHKKNTKAVTVKRNGVARTVENEGIREELPEFFKSQKRYENLLGLSDGDARNNKLYLHKMQIIGMNGATSILEFINYHVFAEPLPIEEFQTVAREEVKPTSDKGNEYKIANYLIKKLNCVKYAGNLYFREVENEEYVCDDDLIIKIIFKTCGEVNMRYVEEVRNQIVARAKTIPIDTVFHIKFQNGYLERGKFIDLMTDEFTPYSIDVYYDPDAPRVPIVDNYINHLTGGSENYKKLLMEVLGHTLIVDPEFKRLLAKFFIFIGSGGNGKGTLLQIIKQILTPKNVTGMSISELADERYLNTLRGKLANLGDDIQDAAINNNHMKVLKNISTCDYMSIRELYKNSVNMFFTSTLIFTSNHLLKSFEKGESYKRRVMWLPMFTEVNEDNKDPKFISKLTSKESLEYWVRLMIEGYMRLYENSKFTESDVVERYNRDYHKENNPYLIYIDGMSITDFIDKPVKDVNQACQEWCDDNDIEFKRNMFTNTLREKYKIDGSGVKRINGTLFKVYQQFEKPLLPF